MTEKKPLQVGRVYILEDKSETLLAFKTSENPAYPGELMYAALGNRPAHPHAEYMGMCWYYPNGNAVSSRNADIVKEKE